MELRTLDTWRDGEGHCCVGGSQGAVDPHPTRRCSDHEGQFVKGISEAAEGCYVGPEIVEAPAKVLDEGVTGDDNCGGAVSLQSAHRS